MLATALVIVLLVTGFFMFAVAPTLAGAIEGLTSEYLELFAASGPNQQEAERAARKLDFDLRYEGPTGTWATSEKMPSVSAVRAANPNWETDRTPFRHQYVILTRPGGGTYLFSLGLHRRITALHTALLGLLILLVVVAMSLGHAVLRRVLRPLHSLREGVAALSEGDLDVVLVQQSNDEFGSLTAAFNLMAKRVREMVRSREQLLQDVSHELRSPLTRVKVVLALCEEGERRQRLEANVAEMETMVTELLELERLRDKRGLRLEPHDLMKVVREALSAVEEREPGVVLSAAPRELVVNMDAEQIRRVLNNLLENGLKYSLGDSRAVDLSIVEAADAVVVRVADDGPGIPEEDLPNLFEPFFRVDRSRSRKTGGYGLGLSLCRRILEAHGGSIEVKNNPERGASFFVRLPRRA